MKLKEIERTANVAWSPAQQYPVYLACGTAAQQLDASFSTKSVLEVYRFNPEDPSQECELVAHTETDHRFNKVVWGKLGMQSGDRTSGVIVGASENGTINVWDADKLIMEESNSLLQSLKKHTGSVQALDFNNFQENLLASGGSDSEILLWDLNNPGAPMTPGAKSQPADDVTCLAWNCQVQHILASALNTRCVVWDLRKNEPIIKISDSMSRIRSKLVTWHPEVATQLVLASEDDHTPVVQLWDLRFAASPIKVLERHQRGILSMAWNKSDPDLFMTCGKDNRLICWNANTDVVGGEVTYELPIGNQWCFDVQWCPRNPQCLSACSFDGLVSVYTIMGGEMTSRLVAPTNKIADSFGGFDHIAAPQTMPQVETNVIPQISKAPKWLKRPCGATFSFGGKLVSFSSAKSSDGKTRSQVRLHQVFTDKELVNQSHQLEHALHNRQYHEYCAMKVSNSRQEKDQVVWQFLKTNFESDPRTKYLNILGFNPKDIKDRVNSVTSDSADVEEELSSQMSSMSSATADSAADEFERISHDATPIEEIKFNSKDGTEGLLTQALLTGRLEQAVELCLHEKRMADAIILANAAGSSVYQKTMKRYLKQCSGPTSKLLAAVVQKDYSKLIDNANLDNWKESLALILTYGKPEEFAQLCDKLGERLERSSRNDLSSNAILCYICSGNIEKFVDCWVRQSPDSGSHKALQDLIEKVMMLRKAYEQLHGQEYAVQARTTLADKLGKYSELLAAEGSLKTALTYLSGPAQSQKLSLLKYRLQMALGQNVSEAPWPKPQATTQRQNSRQGVASNPYSQPNKQGGQPYQPQQPYGQPKQQYHQPTQQYQPTQPYQPTNQYQPYGQNPTSSQPVQPYQTYNGTSAPTSTPSYGGYAAPQSLGYQTPQQPSFTPAPVPSAPSSYAQPAYPTQAMYGGGSTGAGYSPYQSQPVGHVAARGLLSKKYSAQSETSQGSATPSAASSASQSTPVSSFYNPAAANTASTVLSSAAPLQTQYSQPGSASTDRRRSSSGSGGMGISQLRRYSQQLLTNEGMAAAVYQGQGQSMYPSTPAAPATPNTPSVDEVRKAPSGWNDPPPVHSKKEPESPVTKSAPITQPVYNPNAMMQQMQPPTSYGMQQQQFNAGLPSQQYQPQHYGQPAGQQPSPAGYGAAQPSPAGYGAAQPSPKASAPPEVKKGPLPEKHRVLKETLDALANKCLHASTNPQQKRKLEDVLKKLEFLYDKLRGGTLTDVILTGLHQIVSAIKQYDYQTGIAVHTTMVTQGNFSEISAFMPGIKMLMQTAHQLQVFV